MTTRLSRTSTIIAALLASTACATAQELKVGVQNMAPFLDPGRDFSNVGSHYYMNAFDTLIGKDPTKTESVWMPWLATSWKLVSPTEMELKIRQESLLLILCHHACHQQASVNQQKVYPMEPHSYPSAPRHQRQRKFWYRRY